MPDSVHPGSWLIGVGIVVACLVCVLCSRCSHRQDRGLGQSRFSDDLVYVSAVDGFDGGGDMGGADFGGDYGGGYDGGGYGDGDGGGDGGAGD